jgi:3-phenylpropionate/cinnamic acid dioxygenase small subunit
LTPAGLIADLEIRDTLMRYCRGVDRGETGLVASAFHPGAVDQRGAKAELAMDMARKTRARLDGFTQVANHNLDNITIERDGDRANVESYFSAWVPDQTATGETQLYHIIGRYLDRFERREGQWKIVQRLVVVDAAQPGKREKWERMGDFPRGARREDDPANGFLTGKGSGDDPSEGGETMKLQEALDQMAIREILVRYCRGIDRGIKPLVNSIYHDDSTDDHGTYNGPGQEFADVVVDRMDATGVIGQHNVTNVLIEIDGNSARGESYFITYNPEADEKTGEGGLMLVLGRYLDTFEKRMGEWRILTRKVVIDYAQGPASGGPWPRLHHFTHGGRREKDPSHGWFRNAPSSEEDIARPLSF